VLFNLTLSIPLPGADVPMPDLERMGGGPTGERFKV